MNTVDANEQQRRKDAQQSGMRIMNNPSGLSNVFSKRQLSKAEIDQF